MNKLKNFVIASHLHCLTKQARYAHTYVLTHALVFSGLDMVLRDYTEHVLCACESMI